MDAFAEPSTLLATVVASSLTCKLLIDQIVRDKAFSLGLVGVLPSY